MTFKANWEKAHENHLLAVHTVVNMVALAYPEKRLILQEMIAGGCANINIKIQLEGDLDPLILRVYLRDKDAAWREQSLAALLLPTVPVPNVLKVCDYEDYRFAITEFIPGITLRDLLLSEEQHDLGAIMYNVGAMLSKIATYQFTAAGFFDRDLKVIKKFAQGDYLKYAKDSLDDNIVLMQLGSPIIANIYFLLDKYAHLFPTDNEKQLVHADFDPANILVAENEDGWEITGILDWEFSFSGSVLCDVANMLRYVHQMPVMYEQEFLHGLKSGGIQLPKHWKISIDLLNLFSLLDCLVRSDPKQSPNQCADIYLLIERIIEKLYRAAE